MFYLTNPDASEIHPGVVSIEHIRLVLLLADLNDLPVISAVIGNTYRHGKTHEKLYINVDIEGGKGNV